MSILEQILLITSFAIFVFFILYTIATFVLILTSLVEIATMKTDRGEFFVPPRRLRRPVISLVAPAYNLEPVIVGCVRSLLASDYDPLQVVIVDDGSKDGTTAVLAAAFDLIELPVGDRLTIPTAPITGIYISRSDPRLRVIRKDNGGRSDAINAGLNIARGDLVAMVDGDTLLDRDALRRVVEEFARDPDNTVAVGGTIRIANGAEIVDNVVVNQAVADGGLEATQTLEYLRGFLGGRIAWSQMNGLLIISGAFGIFRCDLIRESGGFSRETLGEDMEVVMRLHHRLRRTNPNTRIAYAPDAAAWTEIPATIRGLRTQRIRWHVGLIDNLRLHREMFFSRQYGAVGMFAIPYATLFEVIGPPLQVAGYPILAAGLVLDLVSWWYAAAFLLIAVTAGQLQTAGALLIEELGFGRYRARDLLMLGAWGLLETFWYRPLTAVWRTWATVLVIIGRRPGWGTLQRGVAIGREPDAELVSAPLPR